jgi:Family of unknown function (DUF5684)
MHHPEHGSLSAGIAWSGTKTAPTSIDKGGGVTGLTVLAGMSGGGVAVVIFIYLAVIVFLVASVWKVFTKAGQPGWASLIPFYNTYVQLKIVGRPGWWLLWFFVPFANIVVLFIIAIDLAKSFGKGSGFWRGTHPAVVHLLPDPRLRKRPLRRPSRWRRYPTDSRHTRPRRDVLRRLRHSPRARRSLLPLMRPPGGAVGSSTEPCPATLRGAADAARGATKARVGSRSGVSAGADGSLSPCS